MILRPWCLKLEFAQSCNLSCKMCPINTLGNKAVYATPEFARRVGEQMFALTPEARVEIAGRGEPTLCPDLLEVLRELRRTMPKAHLCLFTNGIRLLKEPTLAADMFAAGLDILSIDCYHNTWDRHEKLMRAAGHTVHSFADVSAYHKHPRKQYPFVILVSDIANQDIAVRPMHNWAGAVPEKWYEDHGYATKQLPLAKMCAHPFREVTINCDGAYNFCCVDWRQQVTLGNIFKETIAEMWHSPRRIDLLKRLYARDRNFNPCVECDFHGGYRLGLIPNPED